MWNNLIKLGLRGVNFVGEDCRIQSSGTVWVGSKFELQNWPGSSKGVQFVWNCMKSWVSGTPIEGGSAFGRRDHVEGLKQRVFHWRRAFDWSAKGLRSKYEVLTHIGAPKFLLIAGDEFSSSTMSYRVFLVQTTKIRILGGSMSI